MLDDEEILLSAVKQRWIDGGSVGKPGDKFSPALLGEDVLQLGKTVALFSGIGEPVRDEHHARLKVLIERQKPAHDRFQVSDMRLKRHQDQIGLQDVFLQAGSAGAS